MQVTGWQGRGLWAGWTVACAGTSPGVAQGSRVPGVVGAMASASPASPAGAPLLSSELSPHLFPKAQTHTAGHLLSGHVPPGCPTGILALHVLSGGSLLSPMSWSSVLLPQLSPSLTGAVNWRPSAQTPASRGPGLALSCLLGSGAPPPPAALSWVGLFWLPGVSRPSQSVSPFASLLCSASWLPQWSFLPLA